jgi:signal peptidase I
VKTRLAKVWAENRSLVFFLALMFIFRSSVADWNTVPSGSMKPTILEGDRILVNRIIYDLRVPFTAMVLLHRSDPARGDIIVFDSKASDKRLVKRCVGMPGDTLEIRDNHLIINGEEILYEDLAEADYSLDRKEFLLGREHDIRIRKNGSRVSDFGPIEVPPGEYLALGDNRDDSADSRYIGFVPRAEIIGRSRTVVASLDYGNHYLPRWDRFFHTL